MNGTVRDVSFTPDGRYLLSTGSELNFLLTLTTMLPPPQHTHTLTQVMVKFTCGT